MWWSSSHSQHGCCHCLRHFGPAGKMHIFRVHFFLRVCSATICTSLKPNPPGSDCLFSYFMLFPHPSPHLGGRIHGDWGKCVSPLTVLTSDRIGFIVTLFAHRTTSAIDAGCGNGWPCVWTIDSMRICGMQLAIQLPLPATPRLHPPNVTE